MKDIKPFLRHIFEECEFIQNTLQGRTFEDFVKDETLKRAVVRSLGRCKQNFGRAEMKENNFKQTEIGIIPEDWEVVRFEDAILRKRIKVGKVKQQEYQKFGRYPVIDQSQNYIAGFSDDNQKVYQGPLPVIIFGDHTRVFKFVDFPFIVGADGAKIIVPNKNIFDPKFLYFAFLMLKIPSRGYNRHYPLLREKKILLPPLEEQQKIAKVLDKTQQAIEIQDRIIEQAKNLKKSLIQRLFTEGLYGEEQKETEIGFIPKSWEVVRLGKVAKITMGQSPPSSTYNDKGIGLPFLQGKAEFGEIYSKPVKYCTKPLKTSQNGDILISVRAPVGDVNLAPFKCAIGRGLASIRPTSIGKSFLFYFLIFSKRRIEEEGTGSTFKAIRKHNLESFKIPLPPLEEQKQIAHILSVVDKKIEVEQKRKHVLKELFKTMLHKLMSGKIRVKDVEV